MPYSTSPLAFGMPTSVSVLQRSRCHLFLMSSRASTFIQLPGFIMAPRPPSSCISSILHSSRQHLMYSAFDKHTQQNMGGRTISKISMYFDYHHGKQYTLSSSSFRHLFVIFFSSARLAARPPFHCPAYSDARARTGSALAAACGDARSPRAAMPAPAADGAPARHLAFL